MKTSLSKLLLLSLLVVAGPLLVPSVFAQDLETEELAPPPGMNDLKSAPAPADPKAKAAAQERKLKIQFDDELVRGKQSMPEAEYIFTRAQFNYKRMIRLRENFIPEVQKGKDEFRGKH